MFALKFFHHKFKCLFKGQCQNLKSNLGSNLCIIPKFFHHKLVEIYTIFDQKIVERFVIFL